MGDDFSTKPVFFTDGHGNPVRLVDVGSITIQPEREKNRVVRFLKQLFCRHEYILANAFPDGIDASGYRVAIWRAYCPKCGKWAYRKNY